MESNIVKKLKELGAIIPDNGYIEASKNIIFTKNNDQFSSKEEREIAQKISILRSIEPNPNFALASKMALMESISLSRQSFWRVLRPANILKNSLNYSMAVGLAIALFAVIAGSAYQFVSPVPIVADFDNKALINEANKIAKDIDIHLEEIEFYKKTAEKTAMALNEASTNGPGHMNSYIIQKEAGSIDFNNPRNNNIDILLEKAVF